MRLLDGDTELDVFCRSSGVDGAGCFPAASGSGVQIELHACDKVDERGDQGFVADSGGRVSEEADR